MNAYHFHLFCRTGMHLWFLRSSFQEAATLVCIVSSSCQFSTESACTVQCLGTSSPYDHSTARLWLAFNTLTHVRDV
jgi:hypothetical protein